MKYFSFCLLYIVWVFIEEVKSNNVQVEVTVKPDGSIVENDNVKGPQVENDVSKLLQEKIDPSRTNVVEEDITIKKSVWNLEQVMDTIDVLEKELEEVQRMIHLQDKKLALLKQIHQEQKHFITTKRHINSRAIPFKKEIERQLENLEDENMKASNFHQKVTEFDNYFIERALMVVGEDDFIVDVKIVSIPDTSIAELMAIAYKNGTIHFYIAPLLDQRHLLLSKDTNREPLSIQLELEKTSDPCLVVTFRDAHIGVYEIHLTRDPLHGKFSLKVTLGHLLTLSKVPRKTLLLTRDKQKKAALSLAYPDGKISFLALNGTLRYENQVEGSAVDVIAQYRNLFAVANGSHTLVQYMVKGKEKQFHLCDGIFRTNVTSIIFDPSLHGIMYAGTTQGDILAYLLRFGASNEEQQDLTTGGTTCRLLYRAKIHQRVPVVLNVFQGYLFAGTSSLLHVFNISRLHENSLSINFLFASRAFSTAASGHFAFDMTVGPFISSLLYLTSNGSRIVLYQNLLPVPKPSNDPAWMRFGYFIALIIVATISQMYFRSRGSSGQGGTPTTPFELFRQHAANGSFAPQASKARDGKKENYMSQQEFSVDRMEGISDELRRQLKRSTF